MLLVNTTTTLHSQVVKSLGSITVGGTTLEHSPGHLHNVIDIFVLIVDETPNVTDDNIVRLRESFALVVSSCQLD